jgi:teichoic acid transport system ATP-binding protein
MMPVIFLHHVTKVYKLYKNDRQKMAAAVMKQRKLREKVANKDISLLVNRGESVAIIGKNGAGKSTLLKLITGVSFPTSGDIVVRGRVGALLELTAGFDEALTGRENIYLKGVILGIDKATIKKIERDIIEFAGLGDYIDQPVRTYSSGMKARLGFAVNAHSNPDVLIVDEALSVGDKDFRRKCRAKIEEIRRREHVTVLLVTHSADSALKFCERGVVMDNGSIIYDGPTRDAVEFYDKHLASYKMALALFRYGLHLVRPVELRLPLQPTPEWIEQAMAPKPEPICEPEPVAETVQVIALPEPEPLPAPAPIRKITLPPSQPNSFRYLFESALA